MFFVGVANTTQFSSRDRVNYEIQVRFATQIPQGEKCRFRTPYLGRINEVFIHE